MDTSADAGVFLADLGVPATVGTTTANVLWDTPDQDILSGHAMTREYAITFRVTDFPTLAMGNTVTIASQAYTVREPPHAEDDAVFAVARLQKT